MPAPARTFVLFEYADGTRAAYEIRLHEMRMDYPDPQMHWFDPPFVMHQPPPPRVAFEGTMVQGFAWKPGEDFNPPAPQEQVDEGPRSISQGS